MVSLDKTLKLNGLTSFNTRINRRRIHSVFHAMLRNIGSFMNPFWCRPERVQDSKQFFPAGSIYSCSLHTAWENGARAACMVLHA